MYHGCTVAVIALYLSCISDVLDVVPYSGPTLLFSFMSWPSPLWGPAHQGIQFLASATQGYGSWGVGAAMAWQHQTCFSAGMACTFQHAQLGALQQKPLLACIQMGPLQSRPQTLGCCGGPNRAQTTVKNPSQVPEKNLSDLMVFSSSPTWLSFVRVNPPIPTHF